MTTTHYSELLEPTGPTEIDMLVGWISNLLNRHFPIRERSIFMRVVRTYRRRSRVALAFAIVCWALVSVSVLTILIWMLVLQNSLAGSNGTIITICTIVSLVGTYCGSLFTEIWFNQRSHSRRVEDSLRDYRSLVG